MAWLGKLDLPFKEICHSHKGKKIDSPLPWITFKQDFQNWPHFTFSEKLIKNVT